MMCSDASPASMPTEIIFDSSVVTDEGKIAKGDSGDCINEPEMQVPLWGLGKNVPAHFFNEEFCYSQVCFRK